MSTREEFLNSITRQTYLRYDMPEINLTPINYPDPMRQFIEVIRFVGGNAVILKEEETVDSLIASLYPDVGIIASNLPEIKTATINPDLIDDPHSLDNLDLAVIQGEFGVAENGCIWIPQQTRQKVIYFIPEYLAIILDKNKIIPTMHDAYSLIRDKDYGFGVFISGPSKTADIEQALVTGAHGAKGVTVILK